MTEEDTTETIEAVTPVMGAGDHEVVVRRTGGDMTITMLGSVTMTITAVVTMTIITAEVS